MDQSPIHPASLDGARLFAECDQRFTRRSGPGGQNRNKVETAVVLHHRPTGLLAEANESRSQERNREQALFRLRLLLAIEVRRPARETPSVLWRTRCRGRKLVVSPTHDDFPALLAEALDQILKHDHDAKLAAEALECSTTQLINLLRDEPRALASVNARRAARNLHTYR